MQLWLTASCLKMVISGFIFKFGAFWVLCLSYEVSFLSTRRQYWQCVCEIKYLFSPPGGSIGNVSVKWSIFSLHQVAELCLWHVVSLLSTRWQYCVYDMKYLFSPPGGSIGNVSVTWSVNQAKSNATKNADYVADGATLNFRPGETTRSE